MRGASSTEICSTILLICVGVIAIGIVTKTESKTPYHTNIHVTDALLREFTFVTTKNTNTLPYNLVLHVTLRNPNKDFGILQDIIAVMAYYQDKKFVAENYSHIFYQEKDGTTLLKLSFKGQQDMDSKVSHIIKPSILKSDNHYTTSGTAKTSRTNKQTQYLQRHTKQPNGKW
ncbi:hypothetical protein ACLB2K_075310 [Fragaria x ananassa]